MLELSNSIKNQGLLVPILIQEKDKKKGHYLIIAGERRWRATKLAGIKNIKAIIVENNNEKLNSLSAIIENIQREDLTAVEEAEAYDRLIKEYNMKHEEIAKNTGKSRSYITNLIRILSLKPKVKKLLQEGFLSFGHARALLSSKNQENLATIIIEKNLNVRDTEALIKSNKNNNSKIIKSGSKAKLKDPNILDYEKYLSLKLGYKVEIKDKSGNGYLLVRYKNLDQLDAIIELFNK